MNIEKLASMNGEPVIVFVRYGFKKKTEETQSYNGILINSDSIGILLQRPLENEKNTFEIIFFPWHNIDAIRFRKNHDKKHL
jgi:hypothetical protein